MKLLVINWIKIFCTLILYSTKIHFTDNFFVSNGI